MVQCNNFSFCCEENFHINNQIYNARKIGPSQPSLSGKFCQKTFASYGNKKKRIVNTFLGTNLPRNIWPTYPGISGQLTQEYLANLPRNFWPTYPGISGQLTQEYLANLPRNFWPTYPGISGQLTQEYLAHLCL